MCCSFVGGSCVLIFSFGLELVGGLVSVLLIFSVFCCYSFIFFL